jgi:hypothetical protein
MNRALYHPSALANGLFAMARGWRLGGLGVLAMVFAGLMSSVAAQSQLPQLVDITESAGISFQHRFGDEQLSNIVEATGAGVALFDYDGDGDLDIYFVNGAYRKGVSHARGRQNAGKLRNALYRNDGGGRFSDVTTIAGVGDTGFGMAALAADYDNDGDSDLFVTNYGPNTLFRNNGDGTFSNVTQAAGVSGNHWSVGCTFLDYDRDGWLDLYVGNYLQFDPGYRYYYAGNAFPGPLSYQGQADILYRNRGDGTFADVTRAAGVYDTEGRAMGVATGDIDDDGWMDIYIANDAMANTLYRNRGNGTFENIALDTGTAFGQNGEATSAMGPEFGDFNRDGLIDLLVPDMGYGCLYRNTGRGFFAEMSAQSGLAAACGQYTSWSGNFFDYDLDGRIDIFLANGDSRFLEAEEDLLLLNVDGTRFRDVSQRVGTAFQRKAIGRGAATGDIDADGDLDLVVANLNGPSHLLRNDTPPGNHWLMVDARGTRSNHDAIGARIRVSAGNATQTRYLVSSSGYLSQSDYRAHFGLGQAAHVKRLEIRWPSGIVQTFEDLAADQVLTLREP